MTIARTWVFPILRILLFAAVAIALVKIAFFPDVVEDNNPAVPSAEIVEPQIEVTLGTVQNDVSLSGTVNADSAVPVPATLSGEVQQIFVKQGQKVKKDARIVLLSAEVINDKGEVSTQTRTVRATKSGTISSLTALKGQTFAIGEPLAQIAPSSFSISGSIPPEQLYRLLKQPKEAQVTINGGPAPFTCTGLAITSPLEGATDENGESAGGGPTVSCKVPKGVRVFAGLTADIVITGGIAENVLVVPMTAVEGVAETGNVYVVVDGAEPELRAVTLGLNDGINVEIVEGLEEGETILQFVPGAQSGGPDDGMGGEECFDDGSGNIICEEPVR